MALTLTGCSAIDLLNAVSEDDSYELIVDLAYGPHQRHRLDLALPAHREPRGLVVFFYGGGWTDGDRSDFHFVLDAYTQAGWAVALPDYRLYPEVRFPEFVDDGARAVAWLMQHGSAHGLRTDPMVVAGHSAGAHIAAMLTYDERFLARHQVSGDPIGAFVGLSGPYDFLPLSSELLRAIFAPASQYPASQPVNFVDGGEAPALLIHGDDDSVAWPRNSRRLAARIREHGGVVETHYLPGVGHRRPALALSSAFRGVAPIVPTMNDFLDRYLPASQTTSIAAGN